jgi:hypothetical protein
MLVAFECIFMIGDKYAPHYIQVGASIENIIL